MRHWVAILAVTWACGCSETTTDVRRGGDGVGDAAAGGGRDASAGGSSGAGGGYETGGRRATGGSSGVGGLGSGGHGAAGTAGGGGTAGGSTGGMPGTGGVSDAGASTGGRGSGPLPDAGNGGACRALPRETPDTSLYCSAILCKVQNGWEIILHDPRGFYVGHLFWLLRIGDQVFPETRYVGGDLTNLAFAISDAKYTMLQPGEALLTAYGAPPRLDAGIPGTRTYCGEFERP